MDRDFWLKKWQQQKPGFHQEKVNSRLQKHWHRLAAQGGKVFVPLCGSTIDMLWLVETGHSVLGVEFSEVACRRFFEDNQLAYSETSDDRFNYFKAGEIELWQGDFFQMTESDLQGVRGVYDRAALIALPQQMRVDYADHMASILQPGSQIFLISMDYDESKMKGPPFSVEQQEVNQLFGQGFSIEIITQSSGPDIVGNLSKRGLDTLNEKVYLLTRHGPEF